MRLSSSGRGEWCEKWTHGQHERRRERIPAAASSSYRRAPRRSRPAPIATAARAPVPVGCRSGWCPVSAPVLAVSHWRPISPDSLLPQRPAGHGNASAYARSRVQISPVQMVPVPPGATRTCTMGGDGPGCPDYVRPTGQLQPSFPPLTTGPAVRTPCVAGLGRTCDLEPTYVRARGRAQWPGWVSDIFASHRAACCAGRAPWGGLGTCRCTWQIRVAALRRARRACVYSVRACARSTHPPMAEQQPPPLSAPRWPSGGFV